MIGVKITRAPGATISLRDACVEIVTHLAYNGFSVLFRIPGLSFNCYLISTTISFAAFPTDFIVIAENQYGNIAPSNKPENTRASVMVISVF